MRVRHHPDRGHVDQRTMPRGPSGLPLCRFCSVEVKPPRRTFCSPACIHEWKVRTQPGYAAKVVLERDCGVCRACGVDCVALLQTLKRLRADERRERYGVGAGHYSMTLPGDATALPRFGAELDRLELRGNYRHLGRRLWEVDHTLPVSEGGGACGIDNLRTLCWKCHRAETAQLAVRRAAAKRGRE